MCSSVNQQNAAYPFLTVKKQSLGSFNSCSGNVKKLLTRLWGSTFLPNKNLSMDSTIAFCFKYYLKRFCKASVHIFPEFSDNFWSSSSLCPILCLYPDCLPFRNNFGLIDSSINCIELQKNSKHTVVQKSLYFINYIQQIYLPLTSIETLKFHKIL